MENSNVSQAPAAMKDMFMKAPFTGKNAFWRYFVMTVLPFLVSNVIGAIPLSVVLIIKAAGGELVTRGGMPDFQAMGIDLNVGFVLTVFPFILSFFTMVLLMNPIHKRSFSTVINGGRSIRWGRMIVSALLWLTLAALWLWVSVKRDPGNFVLNNTSGSLVTLTVLALILIPFQAGFEEILFRGYLMQGFGLLARNRWVPVLATSILFGLMHGLNPEVREYGFLTMMPQYIFFGLVFAILTMMDDGIELAVGAHTANNIFLSIFVTNQDSALQTPSLYEQVTIDPWADFAGLIVMSVIFVALAGVIFRWKDFKKLYSGITA